MLPEGTKTPCVEDHAYCSTDTRYVIFVVGALFIQGTNLHKVRSNDRKTA